MGNRSDRLCQDSILSLFREVADSLNDIDAIVFIFCHDGIEGLVALCMKKIKAGTPFTNRY